MHGQTIAIANQKGGVGKTSTTVNLSHALRTLGARVLMLDCDPQGSLAIVAGVDPKDLITRDEQELTLYDALAKGKNLESLVMKREGGADLIPSTIRLANAEQELTSPFGVAGILRKKLQPLRALYDFIVIDCPPYLGLLTINALAAADKVLVPCKTDYLSALGIPLLLARIDDVRVEANPDIEVLGILPTMFNSRAKHDSEVLEQLRVIGTQRAVRVFDPIHSATAFNRATVEGVPALELAPSTPGIEVYELIAKEIYAARKAA